jgi:hypothetical protein
MGSCTSAPEAPKKPKDKSTGAAAAITLLRQTTAAAAAAAVAAAKRAEENAAFQLQAANLQLPRHAAVYHVVNPVLERAYERKKKKLAERLGAANINERFLFHGTSFANSEAIISNNFRLSKVRGTSTGVLQASLNVSSFTR